MGRNKKKHRQQSRKRSVKKSRKQKRNQKKNTMKAKVCSPSRKGLKKFTCYDNESLNKIKDLWNTRHPDHKIKSDSDKKIWEELRSNMKDVCDNEKCWLRQNFAKNKLPSNLLNYTFAPNSPSSWKKNPNEWLTSLDINRIMKQYEDKYCSFKFLGPAPIDFDLCFSDKKCVWNELRYFELKEQLTKHKRKIGIIFNIDPHYKGGSHWVSMFIDLKNKYIMYFDSTGEEIPEEITKLMNRIMEQAAKLNIKLKSYINKKAHQKGDTECGMYSLYFIIELLENKKQPKYFMSNSIPDINMEKLRKQYFNQSNN